MATNSHLWITADKIYHGNGMDTLMDIHEYNKQIF